MSDQALIIMLGALVLAISTLRLVRQRLLSIRYGIGWLVVAFVALVGSPVLAVAAKHVQIFGFTPTGFSAGLFILFLGLVCLQLSISLSGIQRALQDVAEHAAHVEARLRALERAAEPNPNPEPVGAGDRQEPR